ncbi:hypothetical protein FZEAL_7264 [Fusarium zealandicum]|uniref:Uncharacterized protein n=1 Tax=Fusarium zealandicum TaxID=1053134 RepID=A0A8H4UGV1_9HYPO|nr:hypothetical protein FZEAL_7264 [Fusarium zealandicum]
MGWLDIILAPVTVAKKIVVQTLYLQYEKPLTIFDPIVTLGETLTSPFADYAPDSVRDLASQIREATKPNDL